MSVFYRRVFHPLYHWLKKDGLSELSREIENNQWLSRGQIDVLQQKKLERLLTFAASNVPYYQTLLGDSGWCDGKTLDFSAFGKVPLLTKTIIRNHLVELTSMNLSGNTLIENSTSGSTGVALRFYTDGRSNTYRKGTVMRNKGWVGWRLGDPQVSLWGASMDEKLAVSLRGRLHNLITGHRYLSADNLTDERMEKYARRILMFKPVLLVSYPGPLEQFAKYCESKNTKFPSLKGIITSAENLWAHQRELIERAFEVAVFNRYGSREVGDVAQECEMHEGLHVNSDRFLVEILDDNGTACPSGRSGKVVVTDLDNYGMPFIRYEIGDNAAWSEESNCACGRGFPLLQSIDGRTMDIIHTRSGNKLGGTFWTILFKARPGIRQFQIVQDNLDGVLVKYIPDRHFSAHSLDYFTRKIKIECGVDFEVVYREVDVIDLTASGKHRLIMSNCGTDHDLVP